MNLNVLILPGDGIGVEVTREAVKVLQRVAAKYNHTLELSDGLLGGIAIHKCGTPLPQETIDLAQKADATLMGAVGLPEFDNAPPEKRPERGLLGIRKVLGVFANLRPVRTYASLLDSSPLKNDRIAGTDMIIVRELTGGIYYGTPRGIHGEGKQAYAVNTMSYTYAEIERVTRVAMSLARNRRKKVTSVDKSNVIENSQLWRRVVVEIAAEYPDVELDHLLVDNCAMQLVLNPRRFDVLLTENELGVLHRRVLAVLRAEAEDLAVEPLGRRDVGRRELRPAERARARPPRRSRGAASAARPRTPRRRGRLNTAMCPASSTSIGSTRTLPPFAWTSSAVLAASSTLK